MAPRRSALAFSLVLRCEHMAGHPNQDRSPSISRRRDRRRGLGDLLMALSRSLGERADILLMRGAFEEMLRRLLPVRSVQVRDSNSRWVGASNGPTDVVE